MGVEEVLQEAKTRLENMLAPIGGVGVGDDPSTHELFDAIKAEIDKQNAIDAAKTDWSVVVASAEELLNDHSKDFRVALYWAAGSVILRGMPGLVDGLVLLHELSDAYWDTMHPKRPRARGNLASWFNEIAGPIAQGFNPKAADRDAVKGIERMFSSVDGTLADKLGDAYPGMLQLREAIRSLGHRVPAEAPPPPPPPPPKPAPAPSVQEGAPDTTPPPAYESSSYEPSYDGGGGYGGAGVGVSLESIVDAPSAYQALSEIAPILGRAADAVLASDPTGPDGHRLARHAAWLLVGGMPFHQNGQTALDGPREHVVAALTDLTAAQDWSGLLQTAQQVASEFPLWLDPLRAMAAAFEGLGADYELPRAVVLRETAALLARAPQLPELRFSDGTPLASDETKAWVATLSAGGGGGGPRSPVDKAVADADRLASEDQLPQAMAVLARVAANVSSPAHKFRARLEIGKLSLRFQLLDIARAQLEALEKVAEEHHLAAWDPDLCAELYANLYRARKAVAAQNYDDLDAQKRASAAFDRLCTLDAALALKVMQETT